MNRFVRRLVCPVVAAVLLVSSPVLRGQYPDGLYAEFQTSLGNFTNRLEYTLAPKAVASFVGLATGERPWLDLPSGVVKTNPFFNGLTFHRVVAGFVIQAGSPNGQGTDGPGYAFVDEFDPSLRHDAFGVLSCANSGPDSNGSQFFVTAGPTPWLNDVHTVFGKLYGGSNVVYAISQVATNVNSKPLTNVFLNRVIIRRIGAAAQAFNLHAQGLPILTNLHLRIAKSGPTTATLTFSNRPYADNRIYFSPDLAAWTGQELGIEVGTVVSPNLTATTDQPQQFFRLAQIQYPTSTFAPKRLYQRVLTLKFILGRTNTVVVNFNSSGGGTYTDNGSPGNLFGLYDWTQLPYNGRLSPIGFGAPLDRDFALKLNFATATNGTFTGTEFGPPFYYPFSPVASVAGTLTISP
jgi:cyclophilin family peptidyl-prolyl cis-trans isomerase